MRPSIFDALEPRPLLSGSPAIRRIEFAVARGSSDPSETD